MSSQDGYTAFDVNNLLVPAFGNTRCLQAKFPTNTQYTIDFKQITIDEVPFIPQSMTVDASQVPDSESVFVEIKPIGFSVFINGGDIRTFNFPSVRNIKVSVTPSDGLSAVTAYFYNYPAFNDLISGSAGAANVDVDNLPALNGAFTQSQKTVTSSSATLQAANAARRYLIIQNKDTTGNIYVNLSGVAATVANGLLIAPGGVYELNTFVPTGAITAIGDIASNANVSVAEG